jgi:hypothetical protein
MKLMLHKKNIKYMINSLHIPLLRKNFNKVKTKFIILSILLTRNQKILIINSLKDNALQSLLNSIKL